MTTPESPAPQSAGLSEREKWERLLRLCGYTDEEIADTDDEARDYRTYTVVEIKREDRDRILALADEKGEVLCEAPSPETGQPERATPPSSPAGLSAEEGRCSQTKTGRHVWRTMSQWDDQSVTGWCAQCGELAWEVADRLATALEATAARLAEHERGALPCSDCGGNAPEFVVSNAAWNALVRRNGPEQPGEYLCVRCFGERALATTQAIAARLEQVAEIVRHYAEDDGADPIVGKVREAVACHRESLAERDALNEKLAAAERVVEAARARLEVWTRETYVGVRDALAAYDATRGQS